MAIVAAGLLPLALAWAVAGAMLVVVDIREHRLPDAIVLRMYPVVLAGLVLAGALTGSWQWPGAVLGAALWTGAIGGVWALTRGRGMGFGDVKLAPALGASLGWLGADAAMLGLVAAWTLGGCWALALLLARRVRRRDAIAFGPFLILGFWLALALAAPAPWPAGGAVVA
ncbi:MAG: prepilin peptidase [Candidatus Nanopelagicales bacterium]|nr:prepilin peptidase [Candidatus Nanopelagicales bacterium]